MFRIVRTLFGSIVVATVATGAGVALAAVQPQPVQGDVSALGQRAGWSIEASVDARQATPVYVGVDTTSSQPLLNGEHGASAGLADVSVDGVNVELTPLFTHVINDVNAVLELEHRTLNRAVSTVNGAITTVGAVERSTLQLAGNVADVALHTAGSVAGGAVSLATAPIAVDAGMAGQSASANRNGTTAGTSTSGASSTDAGVAIGGGAASADAAAAGVGIGATVHLPLR
jgi:hypothetical protein